MNDEYSQEDMDLSIESIKAGAAVFGNLVFGTEYPEHSLCYSPSPIPNRRRQQNDVDLEQRVEMEGKALDYDRTPVMGSKENVPVENQMDVATTIQRGNSTTNNNEPNKIVVDKQPRPVSRKGLKPSSLANTSHPVDKTTSINPVINNVRRSKEESIKEKIHTAAEIREQRRLEKEEAIALNAEAERTRREILILRRQLNERFARAKIERQNRDKQEHLAKVENEIQFKSKVHVEHKSTLKQMEEERRRRSIADRARVRKNHQEGKERMRLAAIAEDQALYEERYESHVAKRETEAENAQKRRQSFAFRNGDARRIRELFAKMENDRSTKVHESFELKWAGERDADEYKRQMAQQRRESFVGRNAEGHRIRDVEAQLQKDESARQHESYELKWAGERDADEYKRQMAQQRRESLAGRNAEGHRIRDVEQTMKADEWAREHESYELKWAGERDAEA
jgi:hypothetical protein